MFYNVTNPGMTVQQGDILVSNNQQSNLRCIRNSAVDLPVK